MQTQASYSLDPALGELIAILYRFRCTTPDARD